jgi:glycosyltransferase involved in cell wall biosynthesis
LSLFQVDAGKEWGGTQQRSFFLARELHRSGYVSHFVVQAGSPLHQRATDEGLPVLPLKLPSEAKAKSVLRLTLAMKRKKCCLVHLHDAHSVVVGSSAASLAKVPIRVLTFREELHSKKNASAIIATSESVKNLLVKRGLDKQLIQIIPDGINFARYGDKTLPNYLRQELSFSPDDFLVGIVTPLSHDKGRKYLGQVSKHLRESIPNIKIIIMGEGSLQLEVDAQAKEIQGEDMVFYLGFREDNPQIFNSLDAFILASDHEDFSSMVMDAMACRLPVIASREGKIPSMVDHKKTGLLVPSHRPKSLTKAILKIYEDKELASQLGQRGYDYVYQKFSAESMASKAIDLYEELAKHRGIELPKKG